MQTPEHAAKRLYQLYKTRNPYEIAKRRNLNVFFKPLGNIYGFYYTLKRSRFVYINSDLEKSKQTFTCAHEIGHDVMHPGVNTPFLAKHTLLSVDRIEREANRFAVELMIPDELLLDGISIYQAAIICGVPLELAELKSLPKQSCPIEDGLYFKS